MNEILGTHKLYSLEEAIRASAACFDREGLCFGHGTQSSIDEASWLVLHAMGLSPVEAPDYTQRLRAE